MPDLSLHSKQGLFHSLQDFTPEGLPIRTSVLFGGAAGPGKSFAIGASALLAASEEPGSQIFIMRLHLNDLKRTTLQVFEQFVCPEGSPLWKKLGISFNRGEMVMTLHNTADPARGLPPSEIHWLGLRASSGRVEEAYNKLLSSEWSRGYIDEAFEVPEEVMRVLPSRIRLHRRTPDGTPIHYNLSLRLASNPAPNWLKRWFLLEKRPNHHFIPCSWEENRANLPHDYESSFDAMTEGMRQRFKHGNWDAYEGQVWSPILPPQLLPRLNLLPIGFDPQWQVIRSCDPGLSDPTALVTAIYHPLTDTLICVNEYEESQLEVSHHASRFRLQLAGMFGAPPPTVDLIDPAAAQKTLASGPTTNVLSLFRGEGFFFRPANNSTEVKTLTMAERMCYNPARVNPLTGDLGGYGIYFVEPDTPRLREAIMNTTWDAPTPTGQQKWINRNKHLPDCVTYITAYLGPQGRGQTARGEVSALDAAVSRAAHNQPHASAESHESRGPKPRWRGRGAHEPVAHGLDAYFEADT